MLHHQTPTIKVKVSSGTVQVRQQTSYTLTGVTVQETESLVKCFLMPVQDLQQTGDVPVKMFIIHYWPSYPALHGKKMQPLQELMTPALASEVVVEQCHGKENL